MSSKPNYEQGMVLPMVIFIMLILSVLGAALLTQSNFSSQVVKNGDGKIQAYYAAKSGAEAVSQYLINNPTELATILGAEAACESNWIELSPNHRFKASVTRDYLPDTEVMSSVTITSTGEVSSGSTVSNSTVHVRLYGNTGTGFSWKNAVWDGNN